MKPPYTLTPGILTLIVSVSERLGELKASAVYKSSPQLRKQNRIKTIQASLSIEGNTLSKEQITALVENKRVIGPQKDIQEVQNAIQVYEALRSYKATSSKSFLAAHQLLMKGLLPDAGKYRRGNVGIMKGAEVSHIAPASSNVPHLMSDLFQYVEQSEDSILIKSCVFHYEMEFIHPFMDGNRRMGRLWQTVILLSQYPVFEYLPFESLVSETQQDYYKALAGSDKQGQSTIFIEYMLNVLDKALQELLSQKNQAVTLEERLNHFIKTLPGEFARKDYLRVFKEISTATASRDLREGVIRGLLEKIGTKKNSRYRVKEVQYSSKVN